MTDTKVPAFPNVLIVVTDAAVMVDGEVVDRCSAGGPDASVAIQLGVHAAARRKAQPLGRPVRATLRCNGKEKRLIVNPDGSSSDRDDTKPVLRPVVRVAAPGSSRATPIRRHRRSPIQAVLLVDRARLRMVAAYAALGTVLVGGVLVDAIVGDDPPRVAAGAPEEQPTPEPIEDPAPPAVPAVADGTRLERLPGIGQVDVAPEVGGFRLRLTTERAARVTVRAALLSGDGAARLWTIRTGSATTRTLDVEDLAAGTYRWVVRSPGERHVTGEVVVRPTPEEPSVVTVGTDTQQGPSPTPDDARPPRGDEGGGGGDSSLQGPTEPVDPDDRNAR